MSKLKMVSNYHWRNIIQGYELSHKEKEWWMDLLDDVEDEFFVRYRRNIYYLGDFVCWNTPWTGLKPSEFKYWDARADDSFFSCILIKMSEDGDMCQIGTAYSVD